VVEAWEKALLPGQSTFLTLGPYFAPEHGQLQQHGRNQGGTSTLTGAQVLEQYENFEQVSLERRLQKKGSAMMMKDGTTEGRRVFFFELPYWCLLCSLGIIWMSCTLRKIYVSPY